LGLRAKNCNTGSILDQEQIPGGEERRRSELLSEIVRKLRTRWVNHERRGKAFDTACRCDDTFTRSLKAYSTGMKVNTSGPPVASFFRRAIEIDPQFAMAYANLGLAYSGGESVLSAQSTTRAWQLRDRVSDREKFFIDFTYDRQVTGNLEKAYQTLESWLQTYPRGTSHQVPTIIGRSFHPGTGRFERAIEISRRKSRPAPTFPSGTAISHPPIFSGPFSEAERTLQQASERQLRTLLIW
jgi:hypothetical protein